MRLWHAVLEERPAWPLEIEEPIWVSNREIVPVLMPITSELKDRLLLIPVPAPAPFLAGALVSTQLHLAVRRNGLPMMCGCHLLRHADCLDFGAFRLWVSADHEWQPRN